MSKKNVILGLVALGAIAGAALLMGTDKGAKLRKKLKKKGLDAVDHYKKKGMDTLDHYKKKANKYAEENS